MGYYVIGEDYVVGKVAMLSCVDSLEQRIERMLPRIGCENYRSGCDGRFQHDFATDFLNIIKDEIRGWSEMVMHRGDFVEIVNKAAQQISADKKYTLEFKFTSDIVLGIAHFVENKMPSFSGLSTVSPSNSAGK